MKIVGTIFFAVLSLVVVLSASADRPDYNIHIEKAYSYATSARQKNGVVFMDIVNRMPMPDRLIAAYSDIAENVELHTHVMEGNVMKMRQVEHYDIPGGETFSLNPHGAHIMLMGLKSPLEKDQKFRLTLDFENHDDIIVNVTVQ